MLRAAPSDFAGAFAQIHAKHLEVGGAVAEAAAAKRHGEWEKAAATAALDEALALAAARPPAQPQEGGWPPRELAPLRGMPFSRAMAKLDDKRPGLAKAASKIMMAGRLMKR